MQKNTRSNWLSQMQTLIIKRLQAQFKKLMSLSRKIQCITKELCEEKRIWILDQPVFLNKRKGIRKGTLTKKPLCTSLFSNKSLGYNPNLILLFLQTSFVTIESCKSKIQMFEIDH